jgi:hypothetical protein
MPGVYARATTYNRVFLKEQFMLALNTAFRIPQVRTAMQQVANRNARAWHGATEKGP